MNNSAETFAADVVVIGAGAIGLAIGAQLARQRQRVLILESEIAVGRGISGRGSNVIHSGIYYPEYSLKKQFCIRGQKLLYDYCRLRGITHRMCGKLVVAGTPAEVTQLQALAAQAARNEVESVDWIDRTQAKKIEPALDVTAALFVRNTGIIDGAQYFATLCAEIKKDGGAIFVEHKVTSVKRLGRQFRIEVQAPAGPAIFHATRLVLAAGLNSHALAERVEGYDTAGIPPPAFVKGSYFRYRGDADFAHLIYPIPVEGGLGIHLTMDTSGGIRFGPDVEPLETTDPAHADFEVDPRRAGIFYDAIRQYWPGIPDGSLVPDRAGVRPKLMARGKSYTDFMIHTPQDHGCADLVALYGIESPGLTSSLAIAEYVANSLGG